MIDHTKKKIPQNSVNFDKPTPYAESVGRLHRLWRKLTFRDILRKVRRYGDHQVLSIMDVGCGSGYLLQTLSEKFPNATLTGVELDHRLNDKIRNIVPKAEIINSDAESFEVSETFDLIVSTQVIEHLYNPDAFLAKVSSRLSDCGLVILTTPNVDGFGAKVHGSRWNGYREDHVCLLNTPAWEYKFENAGFEILFSGSTFFSGVKIFRKTPLRLVNDLLLLMFGSCRWQRGESLVFVLKKASPHAHL